MKTVANGMRAMLAAALLVSTLFGSASAWDVPKKKAELVADETVQDVTWEDSADLDMLRRVRSDIKSAQNDKKIKTLRITLLSPGGPVITSLEIARLVRKASDSGLIMEFHAVGLCASGCTFILAAGTPGKRFITHETLYLVHSLQSGGGFGRTCGAYTPEPKTEDEKVINALLDMMRDMYMKFSGKDKATVEKWLTCGEEQAGGGELAVKLGLADKVE